MIVVWVTTDLGPAAFVALTVVSAARTVRSRRSGGVWWTVVELALYVALVVAVLTLTRPARELSGAVLAAQVTVGALVGAGVVAAYVAVRRRRAAPVAPPTVG